MPRPTDSALAATLAAALLLAACAEKPAPTPHFVPPAPAPIAAPPPVPPPAALDWADLPLSAGNWRYVEAADAEARFEIAQGAFVLRCDRASHRISLTRPGAGVGTMTIRTSEASRSFAGTEASLPVSDSFLDAMVFSRGRISVETAGAPMLVIPTWPEPARVVEECRGV